MKSITPNDPRDEQLDELIALALHNELTPEERAQFDTRLQTDPAAQAAYQEAQAMHDLLEKTHQEAQPDAAFEQRMVSGVRRKIRTEKDRETRWGWLVRLWEMIKATPEHIRISEVVAVLFIIVILTGVAFGPITNGIAKAKQSAMVQAGHTIAMAEYQAQVDAGVPNPVMKGVRALSDGRIVEYAGDGAARREVDITEKVRSFTANGGRNLDALVAGQAVASAQAAKQELPRSTISGLGTMTAGDYNEPATTTIPQGGTVHGSGFVPPAKLDARKLAANDKKPGRTAVFGVPVYLTKDGGETTDPSKALSVTTRSGEQGVEEAVRVFPYPKPADKPTNADGSSNTPESTEEVPAVDDRKLIRNAQLELEVKSFQGAMDQITALTKAAGGYVDTSNSEKGGNGKLHGTVVVKVLPQNLDAFLLKLREVGQVQNQSVSTDDVTKDYFDTAARLENSRRMETQLQDLLKHENSKVSDLLAVERELGRVRGEIEQMQGQLKLYDFQVQYATVTMTMSEKDLNQAAAYLLKEQDDFSLFATDVEATFQKARQSADDFKAQVLTANLNHNSGSDVSAELEVMVAPDQIEPFLAQVRGLGRVANFTRQTQRVAKDGGDSAQPADQTATEKDKVQVHLAIRSDDETRKQVALTVVTKAVDTALDQAKAAALANAGVEILSSSLNKTPQGQSTAQLSVRVPGKDYAGLITAFNALGRTASLSIQRNDDSGPGANGDDAPVIVALSLTDDDAPLQQTDMTVAAKDVDQQSQQIKQRAGAAGVEVKASSFQRQPDGTEVAQMTFRLPLAKYAAFLETVKALGKVESLTVHRDDRPDQTRTDDTAPAEIALQLHSVSEIIPDDTGLFATLGNTFGAGAGSLYATVKFVGVIVAFLVPWVFTIGLLAFVGRRIYLWRKK